MEDSTRQIIEIDQRSRSNTHRLDKLEEQVKAIYELTTSVRLLAEKQDRMAGTLKELDEHVSSLEQKPAKKWDNLVDKIIAIAVAAALGFLLAQIGLQ